MTYFISDAGEGVGVMGTRWVVEVGMVLGRGGGSAGIGPRALVTAPI